MNTECVDELVTQSDVPGAKVYLFERRGDFANASQVLLDELRNSSNAKSCAENLVCFLDFANRTAHNLDQG